MSYPTWSDLNNESIVPPLGGRRAHDIGPVAVMAACEPDIRLIKSNLPNPKVTPFFTSTLITSDAGIKSGSVDKGICVAGPFIGAPYAVMLLESLIAKGADTIFFLGWCGAVTQEHNVGDLIIPESAIVDEGTSGNYKILDEVLPVSTPDKALSDQLSGYLTSREIAHKKATLWTTDAIYRETPNKVARYRELGAEAVEMECSALFSVAEFRKVKIACLLVVSDSVASKDWDPGFRKKQFKKARLTACESIMSFAKQNKK
jgi:purine-nucleoside phosphorylase